MRDQFDGDSFDKEKDGARLVGQWLTVFAIMRHGGWFTLAELRERTDIPEASLSARIRDFRKARFGRHAVQKRRRNEDGGTWEYRLVVNKEGVAG